MLPTIGPGAGLARLRSVISDRHTRPAANAPNSAALGIATSFVLSGPRSVATRSRNEAVTQLTSALGVRRGKAALSSGCKSHPANAPAGSNRSSHGGNEVAEAFD